MNLRQLIRDRLDPMCFPRYFDLDRPRAILSKFDWGDEGDQYLEYHLNRFLVTLDYLHGLPRESRVLDLGGCAMTYILMTEYLFDEVQETSFEEKDAVASERSKFEKNIVTGRNGNTPCEYETAFFNIEKHRWPFADESFDVIVASEIFEHLVLDPMHAFSEANRILRKGGRFLITVPNGASYENLWKLLRGKQPNSFPYYRPEGPNLRHNREPIDAELWELFHAGGFEVQILTTVNVSKSILGIKSLLLLRFLDKLTGCRVERRQTLIGMATKTGDMRERYPIKESLYYHWDVQRYTRAGSDKA